MKILYCTNFYTKTSGGVRTYLHAIGDELRRRGLPFRLVVPGSEDDIREDPGEDSRVYVVKSPRFPVNREYRMILPLDFLPPFSFRLGEIIRREQPDVVEISDLWTLIYLGRALRNRPVWFGLGKRCLVAGFAHDRLSDYMMHYSPKSVATKTMLRFSRWYLRSVYLPCYDLILANSEYTARELRDASAGNSRPGIYVVGLGVDVRIFSPSHRDESFRKSLLSGEAGFLLLYAGRLSREKGLDRLMAAMGDLSNTGRADIRLLVVGDGSLRGMIERSKPDNVSLLGHVSDRSRLAKIYASCDAFITPSVREGFGIAQLEAMASGVPVICPDVAGQMSYMGESAGIVTGHSWEALRDAIVKTRDLPVAARGQMGEAARMIALNHSWAQTARLIVSIYARELGRLRGAPKIKSRVSSPACSVQESPRMSGVK